MSPSESDILREALELMEKFEPEPPHVLHVAQLADQLFTGTQPLHQLDSPARRLLKIAAFLHDIGWHFAPSGRRHHKFSAEMIRSHAWKYLTPQEVSIIAMVARYHRKALPQENHQDFAALPRKTQTLVSSLAALLRMADALDRTHSQKVPGLIVRLSSRQMAVILAGTKIGLREEILAFSKKKDLFQHHYHMKVILQFHPNLVVQEVA